MKCLSIGLAISTILTSTGYPQGGRSQTQKPEFPGGTIGQLLSRAKEQPLTLQEKVDLSLAYFALGRFPESLAIVQMNIGEAKTPEEKGFIYMVKAENEAAMGLYHQATASAVLGQRLSPRSESLGWLRYAYASRSGQKAEAAAALDHLKRINPNLPEPVVDAKIVLQMAIQIASAVYIIYQNNKEQINTIARHLVILWNEIGISRKAGGVQ